jgi:signal transduction histidine kinase
MTDSGRDLDRHGVGDRALILVVDHDSDRLRALAAKVAELLGPGIEVITADSDRRALALADQALDAGRSMPVAVIERELPGSGGARLALDMAGDARLRPTHRILVTASTSLDSIAEALDGRAIDGLLIRPWSTAGLRAQLQARLMTFLVEHDRDRLADFPRLVDDAVVAKAEQRLAQRRAASARINDQETHVLLEPQLDEHEVVRRLVHALDRSLGHPPRLRVGPGTVLLQQDTSVGGIYVILDGQVVLRRESEAGIRIVHRGATGPIVGLLSLATQQKAFLEVRAATEVRALPVTLNQLARAIAAESDVGPLLTRTLVDALANRLRDADELQVRIDVLNSSLEAERDQLADALDRLEKAQMQLIEQARLATLGELAAGIAHELNNPAAALIRNAEHVADTANRLLARLRRYADDQQPGLIRVLDQLQDQLATGRRSEPLASADRRRARREIGDRLGDPDLSRRLIDAGITDAGRAAELMAGGADVELLAVGHELGVQLRNLELASSRIADLVNSLRAYLRGESDDAVHDDVDVVQTVADALRLVGHRLQDLTVDHDYRPVPAIQGRPGPLQQVWTNLITNAVDATGPGGRIVVRIDTLADDGTVSEDGATSVRVRVEDDGPGIDPSIRDELFRPHFTTKHGRVSFGSGLGLGICRRIVEQHGGTIDLDSPVDATGDANPTAGARGPGTVATVVLPISPPRLPS